MPVNYTTTASGVHVPTSANTGTDFALGAKQMGDDIDAMIVRETAVGHVYLTGGSIAAPADGTNADMPGVTITVTPTVASFLQVTLRLEGSFPQYAGVSDSVLGFLRIDSVDEDYTLDASRAVTVEGPQGLGCTIGGAITRVLPLTAGAHTIKGRVRRVIGSGSPAGPPFYAAEATYLLTPQ